MTRQTPKQKASENAFTRLIAERAEATPHKLYGPVTISEPLQQDTAVIGDCTIIGDMNVPNGLNVLNGFKLIVTGTIAFELKGDS